MLHMMSAPYVARGLHMIALWPLERTCWRQFAAQWGGCKKSRIAPFSTTISIIIIVSLHCRVLMHLAVAGQKCWEAWGTFWTETDHSIVVPIARRKEGNRKEVADAPPFGDGKDLCSIRPALVLFRRQLCGDFWERGRNVYGLFWVLWCYLGRTWKLNGSSAVQSHHVSLRNMIREALIICNVVVLHRSKVSQWLEYR